MSYHQILPLCSCSVVHNACPDDHRSSNLWGRVVPPATPTSTTLCSIAWIVSPPRNIIHGIGWGRMCSFFLSDLWKLACNLGSNFGIIFDKCYVWKQICELKKISDSSFLMRNNSKECNVTKTSASALSTALNQFSTRPHQNVVWYNYYNSLLDFQKILNYVPKERKKKSAKNEPSFVTIKCCNGSQELF